jgi:two-component system sensor histidine kinase KdpD
MTVDQRPNPDELLAQVATEEAKAKRGKLKVFFGMAAGVGKTYAMLEEARARAAEGLDVLVGYAEPHIRTETEALLLGMEILPYKIIDYRGAKLKEFDLDAALARRPALILIDELAHTNAPGLRHAKRWQDVAELLDAGINVYTTLNVQHLESVNDVVERISGVRVRETLPDSVLENADDVELVDIAPEELLERFREGKIYRPEQAERAAKHFFTKGNLIALRELALRTTAQRVDAQMLDFRRQNVVRTTWAASERILVCVGPSPLSAKLVRAARRLAAGLRAPLIAVTVQTPGGGSAEAQQRVDQTLRLAEQLGAKTATLSGERIADEVVAYAAAHNVTKIVIGKPDRPRWRDALFGSVVDDVIRRSGGIDVYVIRGDGEETTTTRRHAPSRQSKTDWKGFAWAVAVVFFATAIGWPLYHRLGLANTNILMLYLLGILWLATRLSRAAAVLASVLSVALFDLVFVPPYYTFAVSDQQYLVTFAVMLAAALVISALADRVRTQAEASRQRERRTETLLALSRDLAAARTMDQIAQTTVRQVADVVGSRRVILLLPAEEEKTLFVKADSGPGASVALNEKDHSVAQWVYDHQQIAGAGTFTLPAAAATFIPLRGSRRACGVLGIFGHGSSSSSTHVWSLEQEQLAEGFAAQAAVAIERARLSEEARQAWERVEAEFLRNTLLSGVSHDLRTPLAAITGAATSILENHLAEPLRLELLNTIAVEAERMERLVNNLLDMTRLESGGMVLKKEWQSIQEVIGTALHRLERWLKKHEVETAVPAALPLVEIDGLLIEQVLMNLLDNALEYTPSGSKIEVSARVIAGAIEVEVADDGPGVPSGAEERVFQKFFRASASGGRRGIGLGLAICRAIIEAHGGEIRASNRTAGGASFRFTIPTTSLPPIIDTTA